MDTGIDQMESGHAPITDTGDGLLHGVTSASTPEKLRKEQAYIAKAASAQNSQQGMPQNSRLFTAEEVERFRQQEKDKVYNRLESTEEKLKTMEEQLKEIAEERDRLRREAEEARLAAEEAERKKQEEEMDLRSLLHKKEEEWNQRFSEMESQRQLAEAQLEKERQYQALIEYRQQRLAQEAGEIIPQLHDYVVGNSQEEIDAAIEAAKARSAAIMQDVLAASGQTRQSWRTTSVTAPVGGPLEEQSVNKPITPDAIRQMSMAEYAQYRGKLHAAARQQFYGQRP